MTGLLMWYHAVSFCELFTLHVGCLKDCYLSILKHCGLSYDSPLLFTSLPCVPLHVATSRLFLISCYRRISVGRSPLRASGEV